MLSQNVRLPSFLSLSSIPLGKCTSPFYLPIYWWAFGLPPLFWVSLYKFRDVESLGHKAVPFLSFWANSILFFTIDAPICIATNSAWGFHFSTSLPKCWLILNYDSHSDRCEVIPHGFNLNFSDNWCHWVSFHVYCPFVCFFWRSVYSGPLAIFNWFICFLGVGLYKFFINSGYKVLIRCIIWEYVLLLKSCLVILLMVSFVCKSFLVWCSPICFFFLLFSLPEEIHQKKILLWVKSEILLPMFSSRIFMVLILTFKVLSHFEFILVYGVKRWSSFIYLHDLSNFCNTFYWIYCPYLTVCSCLLCQTLIDQRVMGLFTGSIVCPLFYVCIYLSTMLFWLLSPHSIFWYQVVWFFQLYSSFLILLRLFRSFVVPCKFLGNNKFVL